MLPSPHMYNSREAVRQRLPARQKSACQLSSSPFLSGCRIPLSPLSPIYANPYALAQNYSSAKRAKLEPNLEKSIFSNTDSSSTGTNPRDSDSEPEVEITVPAVTPSLTRAQSAVEPSPRPTIGMKRKRFASSPDNGPFRPWITQWLQFILFNIFCLFISCIFKIKTNKQKKENECCFLNRL